MYICDKVIFGSCSFIFSNNFVAVMQKLGNFCSIFIYWLSKSFCLADITCYVSIWDTGTSYPVLKDSLSTKIKRKIFEIVLEKKTEL